MPTGRIGRTVPLAGHAGHAMSGLLGEAGREHVVVDGRDRLGGGWQDRWDEFTLVTPNWTTSFPGWAYDGTDPDGPMGRDEITARVARYADVVGASVALGTEVERLTPLGDGGFRATTSRGRLTARQVVVATGSYHAPRIPPLAEHVSDRVVQLHSHDYRNEAGLPAGAVLIVGSGQTGLHLAEELFATGRSVYVAVGSAGRMPRRYRGRDIFTWLVELMRHGATHGVTDLNLERADSFFDERFRGTIDTYSERAGIDALPDDRIAVADQPRGLTELGIALAAGVSELADEQLLLALAYLGQQPISRAPPAPRRRRRRRGRGPGAKRDRGVGPAPAGPGRRDASLRPPGVLPEGRRRGGVRHPGPAPPVRVGVLGFQRRRRRPPLHRRRGRPRPRGRRPRRGLGPRRRHRRPTTAEAPPTPRPT